MSHFGCDRRFCGRRRPTVVNGHGGGGSGALVLTLAVAIRVVSHPIRKTVRLMKMSAPVECLCSHRGGGGTRSLATIDFCLAHAIQSKSQKHARVDVDFTLSQHKKVERCELVCVSVGVGVCVCARKSLSVRAFNHSAIRSGT